MCFTNNTKKNKRKNKKLNFIKIKDVCAAKDTIKKVTGQPIGMTENHISDKRLVFRIQKEHIQLNNKKKT